MIFFSQFWLTDVFWKSVEYALKLAKAETPEVSEDTIRGLILKEWLSFSIPAGRC